MKIGILTYHRSHNYGALLQAIALRETLENLGHDVNFVDYWPDYHRKMYALFDKAQIKWKKPTRTLMYIMRFLILYPYNMQKSKKFEKFINSFIVPHCKDISSRFDLIVCGSDQIWRKQPGLNYKYNPIYFAQGDIKTDYYISYAASMGNMNINKEEKESLIKWLKNFKSISVRETSLKEVLDSINIPNVKVVADPTLLFAKNQWKEKLKAQLNKQKKKYILYYNLQPKSFDVSSIKKYAREKNLQLIKLRPFAGIDSYMANTITCADPYDMIRLIANAEIVFTSSYHCLVFSIIFEKNFFASFSSNIKRAESLLESLNLIDRLIPIQTKSFPHSNINYSNVTPLLNDFRKDSMYWISSQL